ncbi:serine protease [Saccharospirillum salsuginis]|uniref:Peptidase n=1 Tax=Saccharospirillum salsuginis TaxID=418750 RepID=A0A918N7Z4_9GAMM|nr:serine protease [Saccharospirillum salsuginis]GGX46184.1 peptidase [Saccharospirillum salsuginis]
MYLTHKKPITSLFIGGLALLVALGTTAHTYADDKVEAIESIRVADKVPIRAQLLDPQSLNRSGPIRQTFHRSGAGFIKLHFSEFELPAGAFVTVSNPSGTELYRYGASPSDRDLLTRDEGDRGTNRFSPMSITGDTAVVTVHRPEATTVKANHSVAVDYLWQGYSEAELERRFSAPSGAQGFSTCGQMERRDVACWQDSHPTEYDHSRATARLLVNGSLCTAWRVGEQNRVFTNNHCVASQSGVAAAEVWFNYQHTQCDGNTLEAVTKVAGNTLLKTNYELDYTLFTLSGFQQVSDFGYYGLDVRLPNEGERIYIPQHGSGNPKELSIESDQNSGGLCRIDVAVTNGRGIDTDTGYMCDTIGGSSGSAVLAASSNKAIALHHFGGCPNQGVLIAEIWPEVSEHFNGIPGGDSDGDGSTDGINESNLDGNEGEWRHYTLDVGTGADQLTATISGGSGDADLYVRRGSEPTTSAFDCRPYRWGNEEECTFNTPDAGTWYISIRAYSGYSGVSLTADVD